MFFVHIKHLWTLSPAANVLESCLITVILPPLIWHHRESTFARARPDIQSSLALIWAANLLESCSAISPALLDLIFSRVCDQAVLADAYIAHFLTTALEFDVLQAAINLSAIGLYKLFNGCVQYVSRRLSFTRAHDEAVIHNIIYVYLHIYIHIHAWWISWGLLLTRTYDEAVSFKLWVVSWSAILHRQSVRSYNKNSLSLFSNIQVGLAVEVIPVGLHYLWLMRSAAAQHEGRQYVLKEWIYISNHIYSIHDGIYTYKRKHTWVSPLTMWR